LSAIGDLFVYYVEKDSSFKKDFIEFFKNWKKRKNSL